MDRLEETGLSDGPLSSVKTIRGRTSPAYRQTDIERPLGDTRPFWITETIENRWSDTGKTRRVVGGFPKACGGSSGDFRVPGAWRGCAEDSTGVVAGRLYWVESTWEEFGSDY